MHIMYMHNKHHILHGIGHAVLAFVYIAVVATIMTHAPVLFGKMKGILPPIGFLLLFVTSAMVIGVLIVGKPVLLYIDGAKKEALTMFASTACSLIVIAVFILSILAFLRTS